jgi:hypothetical protein
LSKGRPFATKTFAYIRIDVLHDARQERQPISLLARRVSQCARGSVFLGIRLHPPALPKSRRVFFWARDRSPAPRFPQLRQLRVLLRAAEICKTAVLLFFEG